MDAARVAVIGLGNPLMGDDGIGPRLISELSERDLPPGVELIDAGTPGPGLAAQICGYDALIFVDAVVDAGKPGSVRLYERKSLAALPDRVFRNSHDVALKEAVLLAELDPTGPADVRLAGVITRNCRLHAGLTQRLERAIPDILRVLCAIINQACESHESDNHARV